LDQARAKQSAYYTCFGLEVKELEKNGPEEYKRNERWGPVTKPWEGLSTGSHETVGLEMVTGVPLSTARNRP